MELLDPKPDAIDIHLWFSNRPINVDVHILSHRLVEFQVELCINRSNHHVQLCLRETVYLLVNNIETWYANGEALQS